ncbi:MAG: aldo/keto reductase [Dehalococcoidales bacterium]|nr:MAG: aldo/keto reductase [Dehalococcoidales bacterium]
MNLKKIGNTGIEVAAVGIGTWEIGGGLSPDKSKDSEGIQAIKKGIELGMTLIDTAEKYADGHAEELVGEAIRSFSRDNLFIVSKVWPDHLHYDEVLKAAERSLRRLGIDRLDLYLVHHPNPDVPLQETMAAMEELVRRGMVKSIGVSNFNVEQMEEAGSCLENNEIIVNQLPYSLLDRDIEKEVLPYCAQKNITVMAYWPLSRGRLAKDEFLSNIGENYGKTPAQVAINWLINHENVIAIPKATNPEHLKQNAEAANWRLSKNDIELISSHFQ